MKNTSTTNLANLNILLDLWEESLGKKNLRDLDKIAKKWLRHKYAAYRNEVFALANVMNRPGVFAFNMFPRIGCTTAVTEEGTMLRTLDFSQPGLGALIEKSTVECDLGNYIELSWPGFSGVCTGIAPGRFAVTYNEAPFENTWWKTHFKIPNTRAWPPMWLIRHVMEVCENFNEARYMLCTEPLAVPAIFTLISEGGSGCIIERTEKGHHIHAAPAIAGNHWNNDKFEGLPNPSKETSEQRVIALKRSLEEGKAENFSWCTTPVNRQGHTAFALEVNLQENKMNLWNVETGAAPESIALT